MERAEKVSDKYWFQNMKYTFALVAFLLLVVIFFLWINSEAFTVFGFAGRVFDESVSSGETIGQFPRSK